MCAYSQPSRGRDDEPNRIRNLVLWANFEGRNGGKLEVYTDQQKKVTELELETLPVWNGMAAANERVFISLKNGRLICLGE